MYKTIGAMNEITFELLPQAVSQLYTKVEHIERLLLEKSNESQTEPDRWFNINELCTYLPDKPAVPTVYGWVHAALIPVHKGQKRLRFLKSEIDAWLLEGRKKTFAEIGREANQYIRNKKGPNNGK